MKSTAEEFGQECMQAILTVKKAAEANGDRFMSSQIATICAELFLRHTKKARIKKPINAMSDADFIEFLESSEHLKGVDIQKEIGKCQFWCSANGNPPPTRKRIINWLNKAERTLQFDASGKSSTRPVKVFGLPEPDGWKQFVRDNMTDPSHADRNWATMPLDYQKYITQAMKKSQ